MEQVSVREEYAIKVVNYSKKFKNFLAVNKANIKIGKGKIHGFIGPNGAGKTTTIKAFIGAYSNFRGSIKIGGYDAGTIKAKALIGYIPEHASFPKYQTCLEYLITMGELYGFSNKVALEKSLKILGDLELLEDKNRKPFTFSSGMKKKVLIAQAIMHDPEILILDEPAANLDPTVRKELFDMIKNLNKKGKTIFISSHILAELENLIEEVTFISKGVIRYSGSLKNDAKISFNIYFNEIDPIVEKIIKKYKGIAKDKFYQFVFKTIDDKFNLLKELSEKKIQILKIISSSTDLQGIYNELITDEKKQKVFSWMGDKE